MIIFNLPALGQAILVFLVILILEWIGVGNSIAGIPSDALLVLIIAIVTTITDLNGVKGRLFYIPSWILAIAATIFVMEEMTYADDYLESVYLVYSILGLLLVYYYFGYIKRTKRKWLKSTMAMQLLKQESRLAPVSQQRFWLLASNIYYYPTFVFMNANGIWSAFYRKAIVSDEFLRHYTEFINLIDLEKIYNDEHKKWILELKEALNRTKRFSEYIHPENAFQHLARVIDYKNKNLNSDEN